ncbi:MAG: nucleotide exchange factor GrpE [Candidatus Magasanikbacteria bacterium]
MEQEKQKKDEKENKNLEELKEKLEDCLEKQEKYLSGWKKAKANFENYKKREEERFEKNRRKAKENFLEELIPVLDSFNASLQKEGDTIKKEGVRQIKKQLLNTLSGLGLKEIDPEKGEEFDSSRHEAIAKVESEMDENKVVDILEKGYFMNDKILRPAKVKVSKGQNKEDK